MSHVKAYCPFGGGLCDHGGLDRCGVGFCGVMECKTHFEVYWKKEIDSEAEEKTIQMLVDGIEDAVTELPDMPGEALAKLKELLEKAKQ
jgi:hypothetical protein